MILSLKDIRRSPGRFVATMAGVGLLVSVVLTMNGIYRGNIKEGLWLIRASGADLWVVEAERGGPFNERSRLPSRADRSISAVSGVVEAAPFVSGTIHRSLGGTPRQFTIVGYDIHASLGGPRDIVHGRPLRSSHFEMVADRKLDLALHQTVRLGLHDYTVVGITKGAVDPSGLPLMYLSLQDAQEVLFQFDNERLRSDRASRAAFGPVDTDEAAQERDAARSLNAVLVRLAAPHLGTAVGREIAETLHYNVLTTTEQEALMLQGRLVPITAPLVLFRSLLMLVCVVIMSLVVYVFTIEKLPTIATIKLMGAPARLVLRLVLDQALLLAMSGFAIGAVLVTAWKDVFPRTLVFVPFDTIVTLTAMFVGGLVASLLGIRRAMRIEPSAALGG